MITLLRPTDLVDVEELLAHHAASSMFLRSNLRQGGIVDRGERFQATWVGLRERGELVGLVAHGWNGNLLLQARVGAVELAREAIERSGRALGGLVGPWAQVEAVREGLALRERATRLDSREDLFELDLRALIVPEALREGRIGARRAEPRDLDVLAAYRCAYQVETIGLPATEATLAEARASVEHGIALGDCWVATVQDEPVATSAFNARLPDCVQIGGVYTPVELRGRGHARCSVAGSLLAARSEGVERSILFTGAENEPARRSYEALGYRIIGDYGLVLFA